MAAPLGSCSSRADDGITSLRNLLSRRQNLAPCINEVFDAFLAKTKRLERCDGRSSTSGFEREYRTLCSSIDQAKGYEASLTLQTGATKLKNRYRDVLPIEKTRVKLQNTMDGYINANYIDEDYIACCAPVPAAIQDFWQMVWQCNVYVVLMLTNFVERERLKADIYWDTCPDNVVDFGGVYVKLMDEKQQSVRLGFTVRTFKMWKVDEKGQVGECRVIRHLQLTTWPDHGVLRNFQVVAPLLDAMHSYRREASQKHRVEARVVVHCSAGIGRSGTFIAIDILLKQLHRVLTDINGSVEEKARAMQLAVDIPRVIYRLRSQRPGMVQTPEQYQMIYQYLAAVVSDNQPW